MRYILILAILAAAALPAYGEDWTAPTTQTSSVPVSAPKDAPITYKGRRIPKDQAQDWFRKYGKNFVMLDGKPVDVGRGLLDPVLIKADKSPNRGDVAYPAGKDKQSGKAKVTGTGDGYVTVECQPGSLVRVGGEKEAERKAVTFRVMTSKKYQSGEAFTAPVVFVEDKTEDGVKIQVWQEYQPVSEADFFAALAGGTVLKDYKLATKPMPEAKTKSLMNNNNMTSKMKEEIMAKRLAENSEIESAEIK